MPSSTSSSSSSGSSDRSLSSAEGCAAMEDLCNAGRYMHQAPPPPPRAYVLDYAMLSLYHDHKKHHHHRSPPPHHHPHHSWPPPSSHHHHHGSLRIRPSKPLKKVRKLHLKLLKRSYRKGHPRPRPWSACRFQKYGDLYDPNPALGMFYDGEPHEIHDLSPGCFLHYQERMGSCAGKSAPPPHGILSGMGKGHDRHGYHQLHSPPLAGPIRHHLGHHGRRSPSPPHSPGKRGKRHRHGRFIGMHSPPPAARHNEEGAAAAGKGVRIRSEIIVVPPRIGNVAHHEPPQLIGHLEPDGTDFPQAGSME